MKTATIRKALMMVVGAAAVPALLSTGAGTSAADTGTVYFAADGFQCSITADGTVGCDLATPTTMYIYNNFQVPFQVREVLIDVPWAPAHPGFDPGTPHTLPGGNPDIHKVGHPSGSGADAGPQVDHGGATCRVGFHGSFSCTSKGHQFNYYEAINAS